MALGIFSNQQGAPRDRNVTRKGLPEDTTPSPRQIDGFDLSAAAPAPRTVQVLGSQVPVPTAPPTRTTRNPPTQRTNLADSNRTATGAPLERRGAGLAGDQGTAQQTGAPATAPQPFEPRPSQDFLGEIPENVLNQFTGVQYHVALSMIPKANVPAIQEQIPIQSGSTSSGQDNLDFLAQELRSLGAVTLASTGDVFGENESTFSARDSLSSSQIAFAEAQGQAIGGDVTVDVSGRNYYNIKNMTLENIMSPAPQNPFVSTIVTGKMTIVEPHGFKLHEDIRDLSLQLGYVNLNQGRALYRLDIYFSGWNQDTGEWSVFIPMDTRKSRKVSLLTYYFHLAKLEAVVDHTGTTYDVSLVPAGHVAYRPEEISVEAASIFNGGLSQAETFGGFLDKLKQHMEKAVEDRTNGQVLREYEFIAPEELKAAKFFSGRFENKRGFMGVDPQSGGTVVTGRDVNILNVIQDAIQDLEIVWDKFLKKEIDPRHLKPRVHWGIRFNTVFITGANENIHDYRKIKLQYIIEPFITYKKSTINNKNDAEQTVTQSSQVERVQQMLSFGMVNRVYDYINTPTNTEVIDFKIDLKNFYYHTLFNPTENATTGGIAQAESSSSGDNKRKQQFEEVVRETNADGASGGGGGGAFTNSVGSPACLATQSNNGYDVIGGGLGEMAKSDFHGSTRSADQLKKQEYHANLDDHIRNDLIVLENFQVRGDPVWMLSPYGNESGNVVESPEAAGDARIQTQSSRCIFLRMLAPVQNDLMNPNRPPPNISCNVIGGFYEIYKVTSQFDGGKFTQTLDGHKILNLNFVETYINIVQSGQIDTSPAGTATNRIPAGRANTAVVQSILGSGGNIST